MLNKNNFTKFRSKFTKFLITVMKYFEILTLICVYCKNR